MVTVIEGAAEGGAADRLKPRCTQGAKVKAIVPGGWRLSIPAGEAGDYRLAQLDDYGGLKRGEFPHSAPISLRLRARASHVDIPGTWGFGLWNDPLGMALPGGAGGMRLPAFPNAAWFFHASGHNHLALRDDLPGNGWLATSYRSPGLNALRLFPWAILLPLAGFPSVARLLRRRAGSIFRQDGTAMSVDSDEWNEYELLIQEEIAVFRVGGGTVLETHVVPAGRLGLVIWVDNQYMAYPPDGHLRWGTLSNPQPVWIEIDCLTIT
jgi:hypothetical protein